MIALQRIPSAPRTAALAEHVNGMLYPYRPAVKRSTASQSCVCEIWARGRYCFRYATFPEMYQPRAIYEYTA